MSASILPALLILSACSNEECLDNKNSLPLAGFYSSGEVPKAISLDRVSIYGIGAPGDSVLQDSVSGLKETYLPFRIDQEETSYVIRYISGTTSSASGLADTIRFSYDIVPWFVSDACGAVYYYKMREIITTHNIIDSVTCPDGVITNADKENIHIYFRVAEEN